MLRTLRNQVVRNYLKKSVKCDFSRCIGTELVRKKHYSILCTSPQGLLNKAPDYNQRRHYADLPSHTKVNLPALSPTMDSGSILSWEKKEGDKLNEGDLLCEIETDKATMGFETPEEGYLAKILIPAGTKGVPVGKLLCIIVENPADVPAFKDFKADSVDTPAAAPAPTKPAAPPAPILTPAPLTPPAPSTPTIVPPASTVASLAESSGRVYASPMARRLAELKNIRLAGQGSGLYGSLKSVDLAGLAAEAPGVSSPPPPAPGTQYIDMPLTNIRSVIAKRLSASKQTIPHYQLSAVVNMEKMIAMRQAINEKLRSKSPGVKVSLNDFIIKAVAATCKRVPAVNAHWMETYIRQFNNVDVSVAVATDAGLITPIIHNADSRGVLDISKAMKTLAEKARDGKLQPHEFQGGTVTISNLGMFGITMFNAIINPPQSLILACGGIQETIIEDPFSEKGFRKVPFVTFTASADHRVIDGAVGALWMQALKENLEDPANIIL